MAELVLTEFDGRVEDALVAIQVAGGAASPVQRAIANALRVARHEDDGTAVLLLESYLAVLACRDREEESLRLCASVVRHWRDRNLVTVAESN